MKKQLSLLLVSALCAFNAVAQTAYPSKPVKLMVGAGAGGDFANSTFIAPAGTGEDDEWNFLIARLEVSGIRKETTKNTSFRGANSV